MDEKRQAQKELFEEFLETDKRRRSRGILQQKPKRTFQLSYEHLIFVLIALIIIAVISFSLGVERGKAVAHKSAYLQKKTVKQEVLPAPKPLKEEASSSLAQAEKTLPDKDDLKKEELREPVYTVRVASYLKKGLADKNVERLEKKGLKAFVVASGKYFIVCVGRFNNKKKASLEEKRLRKQYSDCYVKRM